MARTRTVFLVFLAMSFVFFSFLVYYFPIYDFLMKHKTMMPLTHLSIPEANKQSGSNESNYSYSLLKTIMPKHTSCVDNKINIPLLVLFSTWSEGMDVRVRNNTCYNWGLLGHQVLPILFTNSSSVAGQCLKHGWVVFPLTSTAPGGAPVLKLMFSEVMRRFHSNLYGYANGDILFGDNVVQTLSTVLLEFGSHTSPLLVVGIRTNIANVTSLEAASFKNLREAAEKRGRLFISMSQDYFITNRAFPWDDIPEVVVGRVAYDNWLVLDSIQKGHVVIDATKTMLAVHQTTDKGNYQGKSTSHEPQYNKKLLAKYHKKIHYIAGSTQCITIMTKYSKNNSIVCTKRNNVPKFCKKPYG